ncbi:hypothetical protein ACFU8I_38690 [Streptomyces sp. NPDC057540]|uniref:hypothetical protein n=1 Tax=Streptomyces sp. NPDC057540 TaxID=3346160 RepID=UPI00367FB5F8
MTATALHDLVTSTDEHGTTHPAEQIWPPDQDPAALGFTPVLGGLHITGLPAPDADEGDHPALFVLLGHHRWATTIHATALYMQRVHAWTRWCLYPGDDPDEVIPRIPRAVHAHATIHCHPTGTWHLAWARRDEPGAVPVTAMRHPAALATAASIPDPDRDPQAAVWAS